MKKFATLFASAFTIAAMLSQNVLAAQVGETNMSGLMVMGYPDNAIRYPWSAAPEPLVNNGIFLYINGSIYNENIIVENDRTLVPLRFISERLGAQVGWDDAKRRFYNVYFGWQSMIDKYNGIVFLYYPGINQTVINFNPYAPCAIAFAG